MATMGTTLFAELESCVVSTSRKPDSRQLRIADDRQGQRIPTHQSVGVLL